MGFDAPMRPAENLPTARHLAKEAAQAMTRWLLVGATGRVGRMVARAWHAQPPEDAQVVTQSRRPGAGAGLVWAPLDGPDALRADIRRNGAFAAMIALAGTTPATGSDMDENRTLALACARAATDAGIGRVLIASSSAVYGAGSGAPLAETAPMRPLNPYGEAKARMESALEAWRADIPDLCILRIGNVAGADALLLNALQADAGRPVVIDRFADGTGPVRSYLGPVALARVLDRLIRGPGPLPPCLNVAAGPVAMDALAQASGRPWTYRPAPPTALRTLLLDHHRLERLHHFAPAERTAPGMVAECRSVGLAL